MSSGVVETAVNNALRQRFPLAVYQVDKVLLPNELFGVKSPAPAPTATKAGKASPASKGVSSDASSASAPPSSSNTDSNGGRNLGLRLVGGLALFCIGALF